MGCTPHYVPQVAFMLSKPTASNQGYCTEGQYAAALKLLQGSHTSLESQLLDAAIVLVGSLPPHACYRNKKERLAYEAFRRILDSPAAVFVQRPAR